MRIAKLTLDGYFNYGNILQKFALHHTLKKFADFTEVLWASPPKFLPETGERTVVQCVLNSERRNIAHVNFRSKRNGWSTSNVEINFSDKGYYFCSLSQNLYGKIFLSSLSQNFAPEMFDNRGTSIVFIHTAKGKKFFEQLTLNKKQIAFDIATRSNIAFMTSLVADTRREKFFCRHREECR